MTQMKLHEIISKSYGGKFDITVGDVTKELNFKRLSALEITEIEVENNISMSDFQNFLMTKLASNVTMIAWKLLVEKDEFDNNVDIFRACLDLDALGKLTEVVFAIYKNAVPEKN